MFQDMAVVLSLEISLIKTKTKELAYHDTELIKLNNRKHTLADTYKL